VPERPAWSESIFTTAASATATFRETIVCSLMIAAAVITTGSMLA
jgi:hypothetical protein